MNHHILIRNPLNFTLLAVMLLVSGVVAHSQSSPATSPSPAPPKAIVAAAIPPAANNRMPAQRRQIARRNPASGQRSRRTQRRASPVRRAVKRSVSLLPVDVLKGVQVVNFTPHQTPMLKVAMSRLGQVAIEFPASDRVYKVSPAPQQFVKTTQKVFTRNDPVTLYPGTGFVVPHGKMQNPATIVTVQMFSGVMIPIYVYPVESLSDNATRIIVIYDCEAMMQARRAQGLAVDYERILQREAERTSAGKTNVAVERKNSDASAPSSAAVTNPSSDKDSDAPESSPSTLTDGNDGGSDADAVPSADDAQASTPNTPLSSSVASPSAAYTPTRSNAAPPRRFIAASESPSANIKVSSFTQQLNENASPHSRLLQQQAALERFAQQELAQITKLGSKGLSRFSRPAYGLSIAHSPLRELDARRRIVVVAVRNTLRESIQLVPNQPDVAIITGRNTDSSALPLLHLESTVRDDRLAAGQIAYYAIIFETPILGAQQTLAARVAQIFAADAPATVDLTLTAR